MESIQKIIAVLCLTLAVSAFPARSETYEYGLNNTVVGEISYTFSSSKDTLPDIARANNLGYYEIKRANPEVDMWLPGDRKEIILPKQFVLPFAEHEGIIVNIPEMRLYYFPKPGAEGARQVYTYPIGIGREGWSTPYVSTSIIQKNKDPSWYPPDSVREHYAEQGTILPKIVRPGPENPLGKYAMRLGLPSYLIHGTNKPSGVGMRVSSGCIRLYPEDIESLFSMVSMGTPVRIVNQPYKVGIQGESIYLEANPFLDEDTELFDGNLTSVVKMLVNLSEDTEYDVDWELAKTIINERKGIPVRIGQIVSEGGIQVVDKSVKAPSDTYDRPVFDQPGSGLELKLETGLQSQD